MTFTQVFVVLCAFAAFFAWQAWLVRRRIDETQAALLEFAAGAWEEAAKSEADKREAVNAEARIRRIVVKAVKDGEVAIGEGILSTGGMRLPGQGGGDIADDPTLEDGERIRRFLLRERQVHPVQHLGGGELSVRGPAPDPQMALTDEIAAAVEANEDLGVDLDQGGDDDDEEGHWHEA